MAQIPVETPAGAQAKVDAHKVAADPHPGLGTTAGPHAGTHASGSTDPVTPGSIGAQPVDSDLTAFAALAPPDDSLPQRKAGAWTGRTPAQVKIDLALSYADLSGTVPQSAIPAIAITEYLGVVASQAAMLALIGQRGDWCTRTDLGTDWQLIADNPATLASWREMTYPASPVQSVSGRTGAIVLAKGDVGLDQVSNLAPSALPVSTAQQSALDAKQASDSDLTAIAALAPADDALVQRKAGVWTARTPAQVRADLRSPVVALTDAATIAVDATLGDIFDVTLAGNRTLGNPTGAVNGQKLLFRIKQDATGSRTLAYGTKYRFGTDLTSAVLSTAAGKIDRVGVEYHSTDDKFDVIALMRGY